jgi:hypothetical protein
MRRGSLRYTLLGGIAVLPLAATMVLPTQAAWAQSVGQTIATDTPVTIGAGMTVTGTKTGILNATTNATLTNNGTITGTGLLGLGVSNPEGDSFTSLTNNAGGSISGSLDGILNEGTITTLNNNFGGNIMSGNVAISNGGTIITLNNSGTLSGDNIGISNTATIGALSNSDTVSGSTVGIQNFQGTITTLSNNTGVTISGGITGIKNTDNGTITTLSNSGTIMGGAAGSGIQNTGAIGALSNIGIITGGATGINNDGTITTLSNSGSITGTGRFGITNDNTIGTITNEMGGTIMGGEVGIGNNGTITTPTITTLSNSGFIRGGSNGIANDVGTITTLSNNAGGTISGGSVVIENFATIIALSNSGSISGGQSGILNQGTITTLSNNGSIMGTLVGIKNESASAIDTITNEAGGTISGGDNGIDNFGTITTLNNMGTIISGSGNAIVSSGGHLGVITNTGLISGNLNITGQNVTIDGGSDGSFGTIVSNAFSVSSGETIDFASGNQIVDGAITGNVMVASGATLLPNGKVSGNVTVDGGYEASLAGTTASAGGTIASGFYTHLAVSGGFEINPGATLDVGAIDGFGTKAGETFTIVTTAGGGTVTGTFTNVQTTGFANGTGVEVLSDTPDEIVLEVIATGGTSTPDGTGTTLSRFDLAARTLGALSVARVLDTLDANADPTAAQTTLLDAAVNQTAAQLPHFLTSLGGQIHAAMVAVAPQAGQATADAVFGHLSTTPGDLATGSQFWDTASTQFGSRGADDVTGGLSSNVTQNAIGLDILANGANRLGVGYAYASSWVESGGGNGTSSENTGFVYGQVAVGSYLLDGIVSYGAGSSTTQRANPLGGALLKTGNVGGSDTLASLGLSRPFALSGITLAPYGRVIFQQVSQASASEGASAAALDVDGFAGTGVRSMIGLTAGSKISAPLDAPYTYQVDAGVGEDAGNLLNPSETATLAGVNIAIAAPKVSSTFGQLSVSGTLRLDKTAYAYANLFGEARGNATLAGISGGLSLKF